MAEKSLPDELYDIDYPIYDYLFQEFAEDIELLKGIAKTTNGPILELMSGTGRVFLPLAQAGYELWGLDIHGGMMSKLKEKLALEPKEIQRRIHLVEADARSFRLDRKFGLIFITLNSFLHLLKVEDQEGCLRAVREHLDPKGRFFVAIFNPDLKRPEHVLKLNRVVQLPEGPMMWFESQTFDPPAQTTTIHFIYDFIGPGGEVRRRFAKTTLRMIFRQEMEALVRRCGLEVERVMGGYDGRPFEANSNMQIYLCRRADSKG